MSLKVGTVWRILIAGRNDAVSNQHIFFWLVLLFSNSMINCYGNVEGPQNIFSFSFRTVHEPKKMCNSIKI